MTEVPESAAAVARRMQAWRDGHVSGMDSAALIDAIRGAVVEASESLREIRAWCDRTEADTRKWLKAHNPECECEYGETRLAAVEEVRALLPPVPEAAEEVDMDGTRVTRDDREYPGDDNHWRVTGGGENEGVDTGN